MSAYMTVEVWLCVDAQGDVGQGVDQESALEDYATKIGDIAGSNGFRLVCCKVRVPLPQIAMIEVSAIAHDLEAPTAE